MNFFEIDLEDVTSRVMLNGQLLDGVRDIKIHQTLNGPISVTIEFLTERVMGFPITREPEK
jgi:hypothetical protein